MKILTILFIIGIIIFSIKKLIGINIVGHHVFVIQPNSLGIKRSLV